MDRQERGGKVWKIAGPAGERRQGVENVRRIGQVQVTAKHRNVQSWTGRREGARCGKCEEDRAGTGDRQAQKRAELERRKERQGFRAEDLRFPIATCRVRLGRSMWLA
eukprot:364031-Chlamydomonas_euryale.AAC.3